jgi:hypothetical protein
VTGRNGQETGIVGSLTPGSTNRRNSSIRSPDRRLQVANTDATTSISERLGFGAATADSGKRPCTIWHTAGATGILGNAGAASILVIADRRAIQNAASCTAGNDCSVADGCSRDDCTDGDISDVNDDVSGGADGKLRVKHSMFRRWSNSVSNNNRRASWTSISAGKSKIYVGKLKLFVEKWRALM